MCKFLNGIVPKKVFLIITHCDIKGCSDSNISERIEQYELYSGLKIPRENVIKFGNVKEQLNPLFNLNSPSFSSAPMTLTKDISGAVATIKSELPSLITFVSQRDHAAA